MRDLERLGIYCGLAAPIVFVLAMALAIIVYPNYSLYNNYLSDLGSSRDSGMFFNSGLVISGVLGAIFGAAMTRHFKPKIGAWILAASNLSLVGLGIFHSRYAYEYLLLGFYRSVYEPGHVIFAGLFFLFSVIALAIIGHSIEKRTKKGYYVQLAAILALAFLVVQSPFTEYIAVFGVLSAGFVIALHLLEK